MTSVIVKNEIDSVENYGFEGPEKILEVEFFDAEKESNKNASKKSLRDISRKDWDRVLDLAKCQILNKTSNDFLDAYVLSESSLFVYDHKVLIKTCGTTTLLRCLNLLLELAISNCNLSLEWLCYSRKNYQFPQAQEYPHCSFQNEVDYATNQCKGPHGEPLLGGAYILGDLMGDHWYVFCADYSSENYSQARNINIMMYGLDPDVCQQFYRRKDLTQREDSIRASTKTGIRDLVPKEALFDDYQFEPCGYSMNAIDRDTFYTVHITPEEAFSYASFETNLECSDYSSLVRDVLAVFQPTRFIVTLFGDDIALEKIKNCPTMMTFQEENEPSLNLKESNITKYKRISQSSTAFHLDYSCRMAIYSSEKLLKKPNVDKNVNASTLSSCTTPACSSEASF